MHQIDSEADDRPEALRDLTVAQVVQRVFIAAHHAPCGALVG
jgi:hypothetical protein